MDKANGNRGFTLMEMVVVLAVIAILAAILTPIINSYIDRARFNAAQSDVKNIAAAIVQFNTDTRVWPIYTAPFTGIGGTKYSILTTDGNAAIDGTTDMDYQTGTIGLLNDVLNQNTMAMTTSGSRAWRGAYLQIAPDPWGTKYYVTATDMAPNVATAAFVISAGPDQTLTTETGQARGGTLAVGGDDIVQRIR